MRNSFLKIASGLFLIILSLIVGGAAQEKPATPPQSNQPTGGDPKMQVVQPATMQNEQSPSVAASAQTAEINKRYRIGIGDEIEIQVFRHPEYSQTVRVLDPGLISMPRVEQPLSALCKTEDELSQEVAKVYSKYLRQPFVRVKVLSYQSQPVAVIGAVEKAGQLYLNRKMRLMQVVALAGGPNKEAGTRIQVARLGSTNGCDKAADAPSDDEKDLSQLLYSYSLKKTLEGDETANPWMQPGDLVYVSEADKAFVVGNVKEQKTILLKTPRTVTQAIAEAGGVEAATKKREVQIIRSDEAGNKTKIMVDLIAIAERKQEDPFLKPNDIIEVPTDGKKQVRNGIIKAFTQGLPSVLPFLF